MHSLYSSASGSINTKFLDSTSGVNKLRHKFVCFRAMREAA
jgi:hypothetical protein